MGKAIPNPVLARTVREARIAKRLDIQDLVKLTGFSQGTLYNVERIGIFGSDNAKFLMDILEVPEHKQAEALENAPARSIRSDEVKRAMDAFYHGTIPDDYKVSQTRAEVIDRMMEDLGLLSEIRLDDVLDYVRDATPAEKMKIAEAMFNGN